MGKPEGKLFREEALAKLDSLDDLDRLVTVTSLRAWLSLGAIGLLMLAGLLWAVFGTMPSSLEVSGILLRGGRVLRAESPAGGMLEAFLVAPGSVLSVGQPLARLAPEGPERSGAGKLVEILSPYAGTLSSLLAFPGQSVAAGAALATIEPEGEPLLATLFATPGLGKKIVAGMEAQIVPEGFSAEEYGYILGEVERVAILPSTQAGMMAVLQNELLVRDFSAEGAPIQIDVRLRPDPDSPGGYAWSSSRGPGSPIGSGYLCGARIILGRDSPMERIFPALRRSGARAGAK
jgi:hypothetical protein